MEQLQRQATRAHLGSKPDPAFVVIDDLQRLVDAVSDAALGHEHWVLQLHLKALHANGNVLLANGAWWWSLPQAGIADETLRGVFAVEELHDHLGHYVALRWATTAASQKLLVECLDVRITHIVFAATARLQGHGAWLRLSSWGTNEGGKHLRGGVSGTSQNQGGQDAALAHHG